MSKHKKKEERKGRKKMAQQKQKPSVKVLPATAADALEVSRMQARVFDTHSAYALNRLGSDEERERATLGRLMFGPPTAELEASAAQDIGERLKSNPDYHVYKAVLESDESQIVGVAMWMFFASAPCPAENMWKDLPWEHAANPTACNEFFGGLAKLRAKHIGGKRVAWLETLVIHHDYQGLGIGTKLLERGLADAAAQNLDEAYLEASDAGYALYERFGWKNVEPYPVDLAKYGGSGIWTTTAMLRGGSN